MCVSVEEEGGGGGGVGGGILPSYCMISEKYRFILFLYFITI